MRNRNDSLDDIFLTYLFGVLYLSEINALVTVQLLYSNKNLKLFPPSLNLHHHIIYLIKNAITRKL
jgi:hypothetical protein